MNLDKLKPIESLIDSFRFRIDKASLLSDVFSLCACRISICCDQRTRADRMIEFDSIKKRYSDKEFMQICDIASEVFNICSEMALPDGEIYDWLGVLYMRSGTSSGKAGQFFTPYNLSLLVARLAVRERNADGIITIDEPACGSGGLVLASVEAIRGTGVNYAEEVFVHASDLDSRCVRMCYTQLSLAGVPAVIHRRDTLSMKTFETWCTPAYVFNYLKFRKYGEEQYG